MKNRSNILAQIMFDLRNLKKYIFQRKLLAATERRLGFKGDFAGRTNVQTTGLRELIMSAKKCSDSKRNYF